MTDAKRKRAQARAKRTLRRRRRLEAQARAQGTTELGFLLPIGALLRELDLRGRIAVSVSLRKHRTATFQTEDLVAGLATLQLAGFRRIDHLPCMAKEVALAEQIGLPRWFGATSARDFLEMAQERHIAELKNLLRDLAYEHARPDQAGYLRVSVDSSVLPAWPSRKEGVQPGSGGGKRVELCHKFSRVDIGDLPCDFALHSGNCNPTEFADIGLIHALALIQRHPLDLVLFTADSGYDSTGFLDRLFDAARSHDRFHFVLAVSSVPHTYAEKLAKEAAALPKKRWIQINRRTSLCDLGTRKTFEHSEHFPRVVVVRRLVQKYRWRDGHRHKVTIPEFELLVSDFTPAEASTREVFDHYHSRQAVEASIKDAKQSLAVTALPSHHFRANHFFLGITTLAQFLHAILRARLWPSVRAWGRTLARDLYRTPGRVVSAARFLLDAPYRCWRLAYRARRLALKHFALHVEFPRP